MENSDPSPSSEPRRTKLPERRKRPVEPEAVRPVEVRSGLEQRGPLPAPPPPVPDERSLWNLLRPILALIVVGGGLFLFLRYYVEGIRQAAVETETTEAALTAVAIDLWTEGTAPELTSPDLRLRLVIERLKEKLGRAAPTVMVVPEDAGIAGLTPTHGFVYSLGGNQVLLVNVRLETGGGTLTVLSYSVGPAFAEVLEGLPDPESDEMPDGPSLETPGPPEKVSEEP